MDKYCPRRDVVGEFGKHATRHDGMQSCCKTCMSTLNAERYKRDGERIRNVQATYRLNYPERRFTTKRKWYDANRESYRLYVLKRRAYLVGGDFDLGDWLKLQWQFDKHCAYCWQQKPLTVDHVIPLSKGGLHTKDNIVPACKSCNCSKQDK